MELFLVKKRENGDLYTVLNEEHPCHKLVQDFVRDVVHEGAFPSDKLYEIAHDAFNAAEESDYDESPDCYSATHRHPDVLQQLLYREVTVGMLSEAIETLFYEWYQEIVSQAHSLLNSYEYLALLEHSNNGTIAE